MDGDADTVSRDTAQVRGAGDVCPFLSVVEHDGDDAEYMCLSRNNDPITISVRYVDAYCLTARHRSCSLYLHAGEERRIPAPQDEPADSAVAAAGAAQEAMETPPERAADSESAERPREAAVAGSPSREPYPVGQGTNPSVSTSPEPASPAAGVAQQTDASRDADIAPAVAEDRGSTNTRLRRPEAATQLLHVEPVPRDLEETRRMEARPASSPQPGAAPLRARQTELRAVRRAPTVPEPARVEAAEVSPRTTETASAAQPITAGVVELESVEMTPVEVAAAPLSAVESREVMAAPVDAVPLEAMEIAPRAGRLELLTEREEGDRGESREPQIHEALPEAAALVEPDIAEPEEVAHQANEAPTDMDRHKPDPASEATQRLDRAALAAVADRARMMAETGGVAQATAAAPAHAPQPDSREPAVGERAVQRSRPRALILGLLLLAALIVIAAIVLLSLGGSHRTVTPTRLATRPPHPVVSPTAVRPPVIAPKPPSSRPRPTAVRAPTASPRVVVPPPASAWRFAALHGSADAIVLMFSNPNNVPVKATVRFGGGSRTHIRIPAKSGTELELSPQATSMIEVRATAPIVTARTLIQGSTTHISYGVPIK